jgi:ubiquinone/menaquinone biosynthesis C-methylase UbiE
MLDRLPPVTVEAFAGVSTVSLWADLPPGARVLDLGCGAGLDAVIAAERVGPAGQVIGVDFSEAMLARARQGGAEAGRANVEFRQGDAEAMPLADGEIDVAMANGLFNLNPERAAIFRELARVLRPGGTVFAAEMILREPLPPEEQGDISNWFA